MNTPREGHAHEEGAITRRSALGRLLAPLVFSLGGSITLTAREIGQESSRTRCRIIQWVFDGGLSQEIWDPKADAPVKVRGDLKSIPTSIPDVRFSELSPELAKVADKLTIIRTIESISEFHRPASQALLWDSKEKLYLGAYGRSISDRIPVAFLEHSFPGHEDDGLRGDTAEAHKTPLRIHLHCDGKRIFMPNMDVDAPRLRACIALHDRLERNAITGEIPDIIAANRKLCENILLGKAFAICDFTKDRLGRYGDNPLGHASLGAVELTRAGVGCVDIRFGDWDFHDAIAQRLRHRFPAADRAIAAQIEDIEQAGDPTVVCTMTEFGREPEINEYGGRHHWIHAHSALFYGGRFPRGNVVGSTDGEGYPESFTLPVEDVKHVVQYGAGGSAEKGSEEWLKKIF